MTETEVACKELKVLLSEYRFLMKHCVQFKKLTSIDRHHRSTYSVRANEIYKEIERLRGVYPL